jgi:ribosome biogenesis GTPase
MDMKLYGWNSLLEEHFIPFSGKGYTSARIVRVDKGAFRIMTADGETAAILPGRSRADEGAYNDIPVIGDWVVVDTRTGGGFALIEAMLPRRSVLSRKECGRSSRVQPMMANVDILGIVMPMSDNFNGRRIERYSLLAHSGGVEPIVILTKSDTAADIGAKIDIAHSSSPGSRVIVTSGVTGEGIGQLRSVLVRGITAAFAGPSGAGKSTLINALCGEDILATRAVRESDGRGRHTTTWREMIVIPDGGIVIDNPGMRELALPADDDDLSSEFADIKRYAELCRFKDCRHDIEPGCAVRRAIESGEIPAGRFANYQKLGKEARYIASLTDARIRDDEKKKWKQIAKEIRAIEKSNKKRGK